MRNRFVLLAATLAPLVFPSLVQAAPRRKTNKKAATEKPRVAPKSTAPKSAAPNRIAPMRVPRVPYLEQPITGANFSIPQTLIEGTRYGNFAAFRLTDGRSEAIVVPSLGRVMSFKLLGGENWLWNAPAPVGGYGGWKNWGGDKTWPSPQSQWSRLGSKADGWPPPPAWDGAPHLATVVSDLKNGATLRTASPLAPTINARIVREYRFENGDFVIAQIVEKTTGAPVKFSIWSNTQVRFAEAFYVPLDRESVYKNNWLVQGKAVGARNIFDTLLEVRPSPVQLFPSPKFSADSDVASLIAVKDGVAFRMRAARTDKEYPDGAPGHGTPVALFINTNPKAQFAEMELLSPLLRFSAGARFRHTVRWSLIPLAHTNIDDEELPKEIESLLREK